MTGTAVRFTLLRAGEELESRQPELGEQGRGVRLATAVASPCRRPGARTWRPLAAQAPRAARSRCALGTCRTASQRWRSCRGAALPRLPRPHCCSTVNAVPLRPPAPHSLHRPGWRSPTTCCAPPAFSPAPPTPAREDQPCDGASLTSRPGWPDPDADPSCTYPRTGHGHSTGSHCGATPSDTAHLPPRPSDHPPKGPTEHHRKSWADQRLQAAHDPQCGKNQSRDTSTGSIHGSRLRP
jgi:hypothetical protein